MENVLTNNPVRARALDWLSVKWNGRAPHRCSPPPASAPLPVGRIFLRAGEGSSCGSRIALIRPKRGHDVGEAPALQTRSAQMAAAAAGFTLVEVLVVITIIALIMGLIG